ncbi:unnamed protein product [Rotaria sp. Silwood1]|nr:unnamed protein product [Rotaria sp. Silwood1]CAF3431461.1 unnamed protein product [Rotaria sp. Silwood1]CAF4836556.1 unnamed protein product [Rotaria sp. Silwood1]
MAFLNHKIHPTTDNYYETFLLCWLDGDVNATDDNKKTVTMLHSIVKHFKIFDDAYECKKYIESLNEKDRLILIVSGRLGREIVPKLHQLKQLLSVYVFCIDKTLNEEWAKQFRKIKDVIIHQENLITRIKSDKRCRVKNEERISFNMYITSNNLDQSTIALNENFIYSYVLINNLLRLELNLKDQRQLIDLCKTEYKGNKWQLTMIREFKHEYTPNKALLWYIRESFLYRMLSKVLREQNIDQLLLFHFIIRDIYQQLKENQYMSSIRVYRGEIMTLSEIEYLKKSKDGYISINTFLQTSMNQDKVLDVLTKRTISNYEHPVLFIIDADPTIARKTPFTDISRFNSFIEETEILFMVGCIFRLITVEQQGKIWKIHMELCGDNEPALKRIFEYRKRIHEDKNEDDRIGLRGFGDVLQRLGKFDMAETIYHRLLDEVPSNDSSLADLYCSLGNANKEKKNFDSSLEWYQKSLEVRLQTNPSDFIGLGNIYGSMGEAYSHKKNNNTSLEFYEKAIEQYQKANAEDHPHMANFFNNIASIYRRESKYSQALEYYEKALIIDDLNSSSNPFNAAKSHNNIGIVYCYLGQYDLALKHYQLSLSIKCEILPPKHISIANVYKNIGLVYEIQSDFEQSSIYYKEAASIYHDILPSKHPDVIQIDNALQKVLEKLM